MASFMENLMTYGWPILLLLAVVVGIASLFVTPLLFIWSVNTVLNMQIPFNIMTVIAVFILILYVGGFSPSLWGNFTKSSKKLNVTSMLTAAAYTAIAPLVAIWALRAIFGFGTIAYTITNWLAILLIGASLSIGSTLTSKGSKRDTKPIMRGSHMAQHINTAEHTTDVAAPHPHISTVDSKPSTGINSTNVQPSDEAKIPKE